jgi:hypothetical protein
MPDTLHPDGFDPERHLIGEDALEQVRELGIRAATAVVGDTQVARLRPILLLVIAAAAMSMAPFRARLVGAPVLVLVLADVLKRR